MVKFLERMGGIYMSNNQTKMCNYCFANIPNGARRCPNCNRRVKKPIGCLISIFIMVLLVIIIVKNIPEPTTIKTTNQISQISEESFAIKNINVTPEQGKNIDEILKKCGLEEAESMNAIPELDTRYKGKTAYVLTIGNINNIFVFLNKDKKVYKITYQDNELYTNKKVKSTIQDYTMTREEQDSWVIECQEKVKSVLKSPSTASFPGTSEWAFSKNKNKLVIQGYVDSQNSFGAEVRSKFQFKINLKKNLITSFICDGEEYIK